MGMMELFTLGGKITTNANEANDDIDKVTGKAKDAESKMSKTFGNIGRAFAAAFAIDKIIDFGKKMVESTAAVQALDSQFTQTFKDNGTSAMDLITKQAKDQNVNVDRLKGTWASFYGTFRGGGADANQSLDLTKKYMSLAADGAAYYDTSLEDVVSRLKSITMGNFEAGDAIGVNINATKMDIKAKEKYGKSWLALSDTEKEYLLIDTVGKIYENSGAMGQAQREANNYSNVMENLKATWKRFLSIVGSPVLSGVIFVIQGITGVVQQLAAKLQSFNPGQFVTSLKSDMPSIGVAFDTLKGIFFALRDSFVQVVTSIITNAQKWYNDNKVTIDKIVQTFNYCMGLIKQIIQDMTTIAMAVWNSFGKYIFDIAVVYLGFVLMKVQAVLQMISGIFRIIAALIQGDWAGAWEGVKTLLSGALTFIYTMIMDRLIGAVLNKIKGFGTGIKDVFANLKTGITTHVDGMVGNIRNAVSPILNILTKPFSSAFDSISGWVSRIKSAVANIFNTAIKRPKFSFTGSLNPANWPSQGLPKLGIDWFAEGGIMMKPMPFGINPATGNVMAGGEPSTGGEAILPLNKLPEMMAEALGKAGFGNQPIAVYINGREVFSALSPYMATAAKGVR